LSASEYTAVSRHVDDCAKCLANLEQLTKASSRIRSLIATNQEPTTLHEGRGFLEQLKQTPAPSGQASLHRTEEEGTVESPLSSPGRGAIPAEWPKVTGYEILGVLGHGSGGIVYKARQLGLRRIVALKMATVPTQATPRDLARFRRETEAIAQVQHPHIVQIYDIGQAAGRPYFALEF